MSEVFGTHTAKDGGTITVEWDEIMCLVVRYNGRLAGFKLTVEMAQEIVNRLAGQDVWTA